MNVIDTRKKLSDLFRTASHNAKQQNCFLCGKVQSSFCKSHLIPDFVIRNIAQDGYVITASGVIDINDLVDTDMQVVDYNVGHKVAGIFQNICRSCDSHYFFDYENEISLIDGPNNRMLAEIALKDHLMILYKRSNEVELYKLLDQKLTTIEGKEILDNIHRQDIRDEQFQFRRCKKIIDKHLKSGYQVIFSTVLDWTTPIAVQTPIALYRDLKGKIVNNIYSESDKEIMRDCHLVVFPLSNKTVIILFYHRDDRNYYHFQCQFSKLEYSMQLEMINYYIFKYSENYVLSPSIDSSLVHHASLRKLSTEAGDIGELGLIDLKNLDRLYEAVNPSDIPNFLLMKI